MLYSLFDWLQSAYGHVIGARLFTYISFRAITAGVIALLISIWFDQLHEASSHQRDAT